MQTIGNVQALSEFRAEKLLKEVQKIDKNITSIQAEYIHFVDANNKLSPQTMDSLTKLLSYGTQFSEERNGEKFIVIPRPGTISPWSSKATDIVRNAGLENVTRVERGVVFYITSKSTIKRTEFVNVLSDRMTEIVAVDISEAQALFSAEKPKNLASVDILKNGKEELKKANSSFGLALTDDEVEYLFDAYTTLKRNPTDVELMMFAQVNSEHCRHKVFNADWTIDGKKQPKSLFQMIKNTYEHNSNGVLSAYSDNAAVMSGGRGGRFFANPATGEYSVHDEDIHSVIKVETHNHPTAIAPHPGAATGIGGEIRDEGATGRGAKPKMGLSGFNVSNLQIPDAIRSWEKPYGKPDRIASPLDIMLKAPIGGASFSNEFGRPNVAGYFRTYEQTFNDAVRGYHKPIMIAGGLGNIRGQHVDKNALPVGAKLIVLGGPAMLIGLGGSTASSMQAGKSSENLDFASVQRANAEMERRVQQVIDTCWALGTENPIVSIHDVGAGGLSNALPELVHDSGLGAQIELRDVPSAEAGLSPLEIWCNEAQERYVLGINEADLAVFEAMCERERCLFAVVGVTTKEDRLVVTDSLFGNSPIDLPMSTLFGKAPKMSRDATSKAQDLPAVVIDMDLKDAVKKVLLLPAVASKKFLITICDRTVGGLIMRDQMVGPWQVPVADVAVSAVSFDSNNGEAMAMGERSPIALVNAGASARIAVAEAVMNILAADVKRVSDIKLSANWMAATGYEQEDANLYEAVKAIGEQFCPALGITIPVGKDSLSMRTVWDDNGKNKSVASPLSLVISAFAPVVDVSKTLTPMMDMSVESSLIYVDLGEGKNRLGASALAQVYNQVGSEVPDIEPEVLGSFFEAMTNLKKENKILAYHDRSDGGLWTTLCEMAFATRSGLTIDLSHTPGNSIDKLLSEEIGCVIQVSKSDEKSVLSLLKKAVGSNVYAIGSPTKDETISIDDGKESLSMTRTEAELIWADTSYQIQKLRDNSTSADEEHELISHDNPGLSVKNNAIVSKNSYKSKPKVAIFREQGVNGQIEMAAAFDAAGFTSVDVHLSDIISGMTSLDDFVGLVACGGFSYGDVLGAGGGWAKSILSQPKLKQTFKDFFERLDTFTLGVCNGCQMLSELKEIIPGADSWPQFLKNNSEQFEARVVTVKINKTPSIFFVGMEGSVLPLPVAHGEGRAWYEDKNGASKAVESNLVTMQYTDNNMSPTENYPSNPNGSPAGITSLSSTDGRATILMPHPERVFQTRQLSWHPDGWDADSPWMQMFRNAREWTETNAKKKE